MHKHGIIKRFSWLSWDLHFIIFYSKKGGTLEQRAITYSESILLDIVRLCTGIPSRARYLRGFATYYTYTYTYK